MGHLDDKKDRQAIAGCGTCDAKAFEVNSDPGFHIANIACEGCDWVATSESCALCGGPPSQRT